MDYGVDGWGDGENVGRYVSLALDGDGSPHFVYYDADRRAVKYAHRVSGGPYWRTMTLEEGVGNGGATGIVIGNDDRVSVTYFHMGESGERMLRYGRGSLTTFACPAGLP